MDDREHSSVVREAAARGSARRLRWSRPLLLAALLMAGTSEASALEDRDQRRLRAGIGGGGGGWVATSSGGGGGLGLGFDLGGQLNDRFALYARVAADTLILTTWMYGAVVGEVDFEHVTLGTGVGLMGNFSFPIFGSGSSASYVAFPIVLGITPSTRDDAAVRHTGFHIWVESVFGAPLSSGRPTETRGFGWYGGIKFGYVWR
jgi:hypothetical protein